MRIIRDDQLGGLGMIPLLIDWGMRRCNVKGCKNQPNTIIANSGDGVPPYALCEEHYQMCNTPDGPKTLTLVWDTFDAFAKPPAVEEEDDGDNTDG